MVELDVEPPEGVALREILALSSVGPSAEIVDLAGWAAHRWHGRPASILKTASPDRRVAVLGPPSSGPQLLHDHSPSSELEGVLQLALEHPGVTLVRVPPAADLYGVFEAAAEVGNAVIVTPEVAEARHLGGRFRRAGGRISLSGRDWATAATGGLVTGARSAVWATVPELAAIVVLDEHDERLQEERNPTWHARTVAVERARRLGVPCVLVSPVPSLEALTGADRFQQLSRSAERMGWPRIDLIDRRREDPGTPGPFSSAVAEAVRNTDGRVLAVLNRKGRARLLACSVCGELVRTIDGEHLMAEIDGGLVASTGERRPKVCARCGATKLKRLRLGVDRVREELAALAGEQVGEITAETPIDDVERHRIVVGTEAVLHRINRAAIVIFLDFDQELLAPRYRAAEQAMGLLARAAKVVGGRAGGGRVLVQTRVPDHRVLIAAVRADPGYAAAAELPLRRELGLPPFGALAEVSGRGAGEFLAPLGDQGLAVLGPRENGHYLVRADTSEVLADALARLTRPKERVRVAVDPPRA